MSPDPRPAPWLSQVFVPVLLAALTLALAFGFQGTRGLFEPDEGIYAAVAAGMCDSGDYIVPRLSREPFLDKPPLTYWGVALGVKLLGRNEWGVRLLPGLCFAGMVLFVYLLGAALWGKREGLLAGLVCATMGGAVAGGNVLTVDMPLAFWTAAAYYFFWRSAAAERHRPGVWKLCLCAAVGLGFLTKGPAILVMVAPMFVFLVFQRQVWRYFLTPWAVPGLVLFGLLGLLWYALVSRAVPGAFGYLWDCLVWGRLVADYYKRNPGLLDGVVVYAPAILGGCLPWALSWPLLAWRLRGRWPGGGPWSFLKERPAVVLLLSWVFFPIAVLLLASSKLPLYALPLLPALALLTARGWTVLVLKPGAGLPRGLCVTVAVWGAVLLGAKGFWAYKPDRKDSRAVWEAVGGSLTEPRYRIVVAADRLNGLGFYSPHGTAEVSFSPNRGPFFVPSRRLGEELSALATSDLPRVFIVGHNQARLQLGEMLAAAGVGYTEMPLDFGRRAFICQPHVETNRPVRLVLFGDDGEGGVEDAGVVQAIGQVAELRNVEAIICVGADVQRKGRPGDPYDNLAGLVVPRYGGEFSGSFGDGNVALFGLKGTSLLETYTPEMEELGRDFAASHARWSVVVVREPRGPSGERTGPLVPLAPWLAAHPVPLVLSVGRGPCEQTVAPGGGVWLRLPHNDDVRDRSPLARLYQDSNALFVLLEFSGQTGRFCVYDSLLKVVTEGTLSLPQGK